MAWAPRGLDTPRIALRASGGGPAAAEPSPSADQRAGLPDQWHIVPKDLDRVIGIVGFIRWERERRCAEIGFGLAKEFAGKGLMTEACRAVLAFGFREMGLTRIEAKCQPANVASARVLEKSGMIREVTVRGRVHSKAEEEDFWLYAIEQGGEAR